MAELVQYYGTGRRKSSVARVFLRPGSGKLTVNGREFDKYFLTGAQRVEVKQPLVTSETSSTFDITANVSGGGINGQAGALKMERASDERQAEQGYRNSREILSKAHR